MSEKKDYFQDNLFVGKNDLINHSYKLFNITELIESTYTPIRYRFKHWFPDEKSAKEFLEMEKREDFGYYYKNDKIPFFNKNGNKVYDNIDDKLVKMKKIEKGDTKNSMITEFILDEELYIKLLPSNKLYLVVSAQIEQYRINKL